MNVLHHIKTNPIYFLCFFVILYTIYFLNLPPWWDGITTAITSIDTVNANMNPYIDFFGKPPFIFLSLGGLFKLFGYSAMIIHIFMLMFSLTAIIFTYRVGSLLYGKDIGFAAAALLTISPLFIAQSVNLNFDLPSMALIIASYYFYLKEKHLSYTIFSTLLVMTKEIGIVFTAAILLSNVIISLLKRKIYKKQIITQFIPIIIFILWGYGNYLKHGWFVFPRDSPFLKFESILTENFYIRLEQLFIINFNWILTAIIIIFLIIKFYKHDKKQNYKKYELLMPMILFIFMFIIIVAPIRDFNLPRYVIVLYPIFYLVSSKAIFSLSETNKKIPWIILISIIILFAAETAYSATPFNFFDPVTQEIYGHYSGNTLRGSEIMELNLKYTDYVKGDIMIVNYINDIDPSIPIIYNRFNYHEIFRLADKGIDLGYGIKTKRKHVYLNDFYRNPNKIKLPALILLENFDKHNVKKLSQKYNLTLIKKISVNNAGVTLYMINKKL